MQRDGTAVAETEQVPLWDSKIVEQRGGVVGKLLEAEWPLGHVGRVAVPLTFERNDPPAPCKFRENLVERRLDRVPAAMKQHERRCCLTHRAMHFVVQLDTVDRGVIAVRLSNKTLVVAPEHCGNRTLILENFGQVEDVLNRHVVDHELERKMVAAPRGDVTCERLCLQF